MIFPFRAVPLLLLLLGVSVPLSGQQGPTGAPAAAEATPRPGDRIAIRIWNEPEMSDTFNIAETGEAILPKLGSVRVVDQPIGALQDSLRRSYAVFLRNPSVEVTVLRRVGISGEVKAPGVYLADLTMTLPDVIALAGGLTDKGNPNNIVVVRGKERIRYRSSNQGEFLVAGLRSGDQVTVRPKSAFSRDPIGTTSAVLFVTGTFFSYVLPAIKSSLGIK